MNQSAYLDVVVRTEESDISNTETKVYEDVFEALRDFHILISRLRWEEEYD